MTSTGALHDLFQDMYRYSDAGYPQEGAHSHDNKSQSSSSYPYSQTYTPSNSKPHPQSSGYDVSNNHVTADPSYGHDSYQYQAPRSAGPPQAPPTYTDVQTHRDEVAYPYQQPSVPSSYQQPSVPNSYQQPSVPNSYQQPSVPNSYQHPSAPNSYQQSSAPSPYQQSSAPSPYQQPGYPCQPSSASNPQYAYPQSVSSSTSELSDISSGIATSDGKPSGASPAFGRPLSSPMTGGVKPYTSGSSLDSSSGVGSYSYETPEQPDTLYQTRTETPGRQDSFPPPPPPLHEASLNGHTPVTNDTYPSTTNIDSAPKVAPPPAPPLPPPPTMPSPTPSKSWKTNETQGQTKQPTRLEQQLSNMSVGSDYGQQPSYQATPAYQPPTPTYQPSTPTYQATTPTYKPSAPAYQPSTQPAYSSHPPGAPPAPSPYYGGQSQNYGSASPAAAPPPPMPDAVLNMAARGAPDKKPWSYAPDTDSIKEQRDKVRRRAPAGGMPKYQQLLNMPHFDDPPRLSPKTPTTPPHAPSGPGYDAGPGEASVQHLQYNSPLGMYSEDNVSEAFTGQTDGVITGVKGLNKDQGQDITQSPVYRMIHGLDADKQKQRHVPVEEEPAQIVGDYDQTSIRYTGRNIPSKSFRMLQHLTGNDTQSQTSASQPRQRRKLAPQPEEPEHDPDDIVDISYVGGHIPSRSFKVLQHAVGEHSDDTEDTQAPVRQNGDPAYDDMYYTGEGIPSRSFQQLQTAVGNDAHGDAHAVALEKRRARRNVANRQTSQTEPEMTSYQDSGFDEDAYLAGQVSFNVCAEEQRPRSKSRERILSDEKAPWQKIVDVERDHQHSENDTFDEEAYLSGRIPILNDTPRQPPRPLLSEYMLDENGHDASDPLSQDDFDEDAYLSGRVSLFGDPTKPRQAPLELPTEQISVPWQKEEQDVDDSAQFDEAAFLAGRYSIADGGQSTPMAPEIPTEQTGVPWQKEEEDFEDSAQFDEESYLAGRYSIVGGGQSTTVAPDKPKTIAEPEWAKKRQQQLRSDIYMIDETQFMGTPLQASISQEDTTDQTVGENFDEDAYLLGQMSILGGSDTAPARAPRQPSSDPHPVWQKEDQEEKLNEDFDEDAYLRGRVPILRDSVDKELPPRDSKPKDFREKAPWENSDEQQGQEFDENRYLAGRVATGVRTSVDREITSLATNGNNDNTFSAIPSKTFHYLRRSLSREESPNSVTSSGRSRSRQGSFGPTEDNNDPNKVYNEMSYVGKKNPSRTFNKLEQSINRRAKTTGSKDPIEHLREKAREQGMNIDSAMDKLHIDSYDPDRYLETLKQSLESNNIKIVADPNEVTDF